MQLCKAQTADGVRVGILADGQIRFLLHHTTLAAVLEADDPAALARSRIDDKTAPIDADSARLLAPIDAQEVWAAGVTYKRSRQARERESVGAATFYDKVYTAERPELFLKATPHRVAGPGEKVRIRRDSRWSVPEPELTLVLNSKLELVGFTAGNDMSARDIEGENPLYLPQAKIHDRCCALGPVVTLAAAMPAPGDTAIRLTIERGGATAFDGTTRVSEMARGFDDLIGWLGRESSFPQGAFLLTGTGIVPPDDFTLAPGDVVHIDITGVGRLTNTVERAG